MQFKSRIKNLSLAAIIGCVALIFSGRLNGTTSRRAYCDS